MTFKMAKPKSRDTQGRSVSVEFGRTSVDGISWYRKIYFFQSLIHMPIPKCLKLKKVSKFKIVLYRLYIILNLSPPSI